MLRLHDAGVRHDNRGNGGGIQYRGDGRWIDGIRDAQESRGLGDVYKRQSADGGTDRIGIEKAQDVDTAFTSSLN